ncbi:MAG: thiol:disulfide interchange protein DsbA [Candidatus Pelagadaptatus aseana]|uniref:thiol:disulfide interchange protein DsbA/DsbL n=1 Tax=Candidatus Pelagadaptatus aseana TaxID=3120508 RepID=UPI0039B1CD66
MRVIAAVFALIFSLAACAEGTGSSPAYKAGVHYAELEQPVRTIDPNKIEVTEVFWYGCGHCFRFEPMLHQWSAKLADDVVFRQSPAMWNKTMQVHARAFYVAQALKVLDKVHQPLFTALNVERKSLATEQELASFFASHGVAEETFLKAYKSFGVTSQVKQADARARSYKISGTPEVVINGKYRVSARMAGGQSEMLKVADYLIQKERDERG